MKLLKSKKGADCQPVTAAFSLTEVMVSIFLLGIGAVSIFGGISTSFAIVKTAREDLRATQIMLDKMETIRLYTWDQLNTPGFVPTNYVANYDGDGSDTNYTGIVYNGSMSIEPYSASTGFQTNLISVKTTLQWVQNGIVRNREMQSLVARNGLQDYIY